MHAKLKNLWTASIIILWIAFALRLIGIDNQSIWYDEGLSIYYARGTLPELVQRVSHSEHPPLHAVLLYFWIRICGDSELSVRLLSTWWGILAIALLYRLGRRQSHALGALAGLLLAISPFSIWYAQETRGYTLAVALTIGAVEAALSLFPDGQEMDHALQVRRWRHSLAYVLWAALALYAHLYTGLVLVGLNVAYAIHLARLGRKTLDLKIQILRWLAAQVAVVVLFAPWLPIVTSQISLNATYWHGAFGWKQILAQTLTAYAVGETLDGSWSVAATTALVFLALLGTLTLSQRRLTRLHSSLLGLWILVPVVFQIFINRTHPKFAPRYMIQALPAFQLLAAAGVLGLFTAARRHAFRVRGWGAIVALLLTVAVIGGATARSLSTLYFDERFYRPDFRALAHYIDANAASGDLVVLVGGHSYPAFTYYYRGPLPVVPLPDELLPTTREPIDIRTLQTLGQTMAGHQRLWLVLWQANLADPTSLITDELQHTFPRLGVGQTFHGLALLLFDISSGLPLTPEDMPQHEWHASLDGQIELLGYDLPTPRVKPGETVYLYLYWRPLLQVHHDYKVFTQILGSEGQIIVQQDEIAGAEAYPTSHWPPGTIVRDRFMLTIPSHTASGQYPLICGLYRPGGSMPRLSVQGQGAYGDYILLDKIEVQGN